MAEKGNDLEQRDGESKKDYINRLHKLFEQHIEENLGKPLFASDIEDEGERRDWEARQLEQWNERHEILKKLVELGEREKEEITTPEDTLYITKAHLTKDHSTYATEFEKGFVNTHEFRQRYMKSTASLSFKIIDHDLHQRLMQNTIENILFLFFQPSDCIFTSDLELRQRWLTNEGKCFLNRITSKNRFRYFFKEPAFDSSKVITADGKKYVDFYYVHETLNTYNCCDLRWADLRNQKSRHPFLYRVDLKNVNLQKVDLTNSQLQGANLVNAQMQGANLTIATLMKTNLERAQLQRARLNFAFLHEANLVDAKLNLAILEAARLDKANLTRAQLQGSYLRLAQLNESNLTGANLQGANLWGATLQRAVLENAKFQGADLSRTNLQGANLDGAVIAGPALRRVDIGTGTAEREIDDRSANFASVKFFPEWRGPKWIGIIPWLFTTGKKKLAWRKWVQKEENKKGEKGKKRKWKEELKDYPESKRWYAGRPTTFFGVDTSRMDASKNPGLKRYIEDEQYIEDFKEKHRVIYWF